MFFYLYKSPSGTEYSFRLTAERICELEQRFGTSLQQKLLEIDRLSVSAEYIAAAIPIGTYEERKNKAYELYDDLSDAGLTIVDYQVIVAEILKKSGFMTAQGLNLMKKKAEQQKKPLSEENLTPTQN